MRMVQLKNIVWLKRYHILEERRGTTRFYIQGLLFCILLQVRLFNMFEFFKSVNSYKTVNI